MSDTEVKPARLSAKKIALLHIARKQLGLSEEDYRAILLRCGGVESSADLDYFGFERVIAHMTALGFRSTWNTRTFGNRPGMATPPQIDHMRELWAEFRGGPDEGDATLNVWLTKYQKIGALRFVTREKASAIICALRNMAARKRV